MTLICIALLFFTVSCVFSGINDIMLIRRITRLEEIHYRELQRIHREKEWKNYKFTEELDDERN